MPDIKFSLVVCAYNEEKYLDKCIDALVNQDFYQNEYEIIIIDNESSDNTPNIAKHYVKLEGLDVQIKYFRIKHVGLSSSRNYAVKQTVGDVVIFIDGDAIPDKNLLKEYQAVFSNKECDFSGGRINLLNKDSGFARILQNTLYKQIFIGARKKNYFHGANMAFRRSIFDESTFIENFYSRGDDSSFIAVISEKYQYCPAPNAIVYHERPEKLSEWIKITFIGMSLSYKSATLVQQRTGKPELSFIKSFISHALILFSFILTSVAPVFGVLGLIFLARFKRQSIHSYKTITEFIFSLLLIVIQVICVPFVFPYSYFKYRNETLIGEVNIEVLNNLTN